MTCVTYRNLMLTMVIGGLWHGAGVDVRRLGRDPRRGARGSSAGGASGPGYASAPPTARPALAGADPDVPLRLLRLDLLPGGLVRRRLGRDQAASSRGWGEASPLVTGGVLLAIAVGIGSQYLPARLPRVVMARFSRLPVLGQATVLALALMLTSVLGPEGVAPFIYFRF